MKRPIKKLAVVLGAIVVLLAGSGAQANGGHHRGGGHHGGGHYRGGHHGGGYYRGGYGWGGGWGYGWGGGWGGFAVYPRVFIGGPYWWGNSYPYYSYPYPYYSRPIVIERPQPQVYVERPQSEPQYWYYCENPKGYYPSVERCRGEWLQVVPRTDSPNE